VVTQERLLVKLVKLDKRHKAHKDLGHNWAFRWESYNVKYCSQVEKIMQTMHGSQYSYKTTAPWKSGFGHATKGNTYRPYWISFVNESDATFILLQLDTK
jgi:hypothetical protein